MIIGRLIGSFRARAISTFHLSADLHPMAAVALWMLALVVFVPFAVALWVTAGPAQAITLLTKQFPYLLSLPRLNRTRTLLNLLSESGTPVFHINANLNPLAVVVKRVVDVVALTPLAIALSFVLETAGSSIRIRNMFQSSLPRLYRTKRIAPPPGTSLARIARFLFTRKTYDRVLAPLLAEFQLEYIEALNEGQRRRALYLRFLYTILFFEAAGLDSLLKVVGDIWSAVIGQVKK